VGPIGNGFYRLAKVYLDLIWFFSLFFKEGRGDLPQGVWWEQRGFAKIAKELWNEKN
jgi:hypothetical protein